MPETWFISDTHFYHKKILEYEKESRPFNSLEEMHERIIDNWNNMVGTRDIVYHLGDFAFGRNNIRIAERLKGKKKLVLGNHDNYPSALYLEYFDKLYGVVFFHQCVLSHAPLHPNGLGSRWLLNVHGHLHSKTVRKEILGGYDPITDKRYSNFQDINVPDENYFNVSCEQNNLTPVHYDIIKERLNEL